MTASRLDRSLLPYTKICRTSGACPVHALQARRSDELAVGELEHIVAAIYVDQVIGLDLGHHVTGSVIPVRIEHRGGELGALVVARRHRVGFNQ